MPYKRVLIPMRCDYNDFLTILARETADPGFFSVSRGVFQGTFDVNGFKISASNGSNWFRTVVFGKPKISDDGTSLYLRMRMSIGGIVFSFLFDIMILFFVKLSSFSSYLILFIALTIISFLLTAISFYPSTRKIEDKLKEYIKMAEKNY